MSERKKQTARKTTGKHTTLDALVPPAASNPRSKRKRVQNRPTDSGPGDSRPKPKSTLKRPSAVVSSPAPPPPSTSLSPSSLDIPLSVLKDGGPPSPAGATIASASGALTRRRPAAGVLDMPISVCTQFATWLENQRCVHDDVLLHAIERDGRHFLRLAKATVVFDDALRGHVPPTAVNRVAGPLSEHARTLRAFAELLKLKILEGSLSEELETAVLRDGEALLRLALCCLDFDQAIRGSSSAS